MYSYTRIPTLARTENRKNIHNANIC